MFAELRVCPVLKYLSYKSSHLLCLPHPTPSLRNPQSPLEERSLAVTLPEAAWQSRKKRGLVPVAWDPRPSGLEMWPTARRSLTESFAQVWLSSRLLVDAKSCSISIIWGEETLSSGYLVCWWLEIKATYPSLSHLQGNHYAEVSPVFTHAFACIWGLPYPYMPFPTTEC